MDNLYVQTPILESGPLSKGLGIPCYLKMEALQPSGSYKNRGLSILLSDYVNRGKSSFITASLGNSGLASAYSCRQLNASLKVVVPTTVSSFMKEKIILEGAEVIVSGDDFESADHIAKGLASDEGPVYIPPHDHPLIFEGISTIIYEIYGAGLKPGAIVLPVGAGELLIGVLQGLKACKWQNIPVITTEIETHCPFATALFAGEDFAKSVITKAFSFQNQKIYPQIVTEKDALKAMNDFANDHRILIEPNSAASLAIVYENLPLLKTFSSILVIVSGGAAVNLSTFK